MSLVSPSPDGTSSRLWYYKGFLEGLKRTASAPDSQYAAAVYDLEEARIQVAELSVKVTDLTDMLAELQNALQIEMSAKSSQNTNKAPSPTRRNTSRSYASVASSANTSFSVRNPPYTEVVKTIIPEYYSESLNDQNQLLIERTLRALFEKAQNGDEGSLSLVKALCREAHATRSERKTFGQKFVLSRWRNPQVSGFMNDSSGNQLSNPQHSDAPEVWVEYYTRYPSSLPKGVRLDRATGGPLYEDIVASRILAHVRPAISQTRVEFNAAMISLFTIPGEYKKLILKDRVQISSTHNYHPFREEMKDVPGKPVSVLDVMLHYAKCGVSIEIVEQYVEGWAREYAKER